MCMKHLNHLLSSYWGVFLRWLRALIHPDSHSLPKKFPQKLSFRSAIVCVAFSDSCKSWSWIPCTPGPYSTSRKRCALSWCGTPQNGCLCTVARFPATTADVWVSDHSQGVRMRPSRQNSASCYWQIWLVGACRLAWLRYWPAWTESAAGWPAGAICYVVLIFWRIYSIEHLHHYFLNCCLLLVDDDSFYYFKDCENSAVKITK